jgi:hypothetical protein
MSECIIEPIDAARAGAEFLDEEYPDWQTMIDLNDLDMNDCTHCILGQMYGYYGDGLRALDVRAESTCKLGFDTSQSDAYEDLGRGWHHEVLARLPK